MFTGPHLALWERILEDPDDDGLRRVLADALQEEGNPRGEFIALQCQLTGRVHDELGKKQLEVIDRCRALFSVHGPKWLEGWPMQTVPDFRRGFPHHLAIDAGTFAQHAAWIFKSAPTLKSLTLNDQDPAMWGPGFAQLLAVRGLTALRRLMLPINLRPEDVEALASTRALENLQALTFKGGTVGERGIQALVQGPFRRALRELRFEFDAGWGPRWPEALGAFELTHFTSRANAVGDVALTFPNLRVLKLADAPLSHVKGLTALPNLETLELDRVQLGRKGLSSLSTGHPKVRRLALTREPNALDVLALEQRWPRLESLDVRGTGLGDAGLERLLQSPLAQRLRRLALGDNALTEKAVPILLAARLPQLERLDVRGNGLTPLSISRLENRGWLVVA